jgi:hypothetical protein
LLVGLFFQQRFADRGEYAEDGGQHQHEGQREHGRYLEL